MVGKLKLCYRARKVGIYACETISSGFREASFWPRNVLRTNLIASKFQNLSGGIPPEHPSCCMPTHTTNLNTVLFRGGGGYCNECICDIATVMSRRFML